MKWKQKNIMLQAKTIKIWNDTFHWCVFQQHSVLISPYCSEFIFISLFFAVNFYLWWDFPHFCWSVWIMTFYLPTPRMTRTKWQFLRLSHRLASVFKSKCSYPGTALTLWNGVYSWSHGTINIVGLSLEDYWLKINISSLIISVKLVAGWNLWYSFLLY